MVRWLADKYRRGILKSSNESVVCVIVSHSEKDLLVRKRVAKSSDLLWLILGSHDTKEHGKALLHAARPLILVLLSSWKLMS